MSHTSHASDNAGMRSLFQSSLVASLPDNADRISHALLGSSMYFPQIREGE